MSYTGCSPPTPPRGQHAEHTASSSRWSRLLGVLWDALRDAGHGRGGGGRAARRDGGHSCNAARAESTVRRPAAGAYLGFEYMARR